MSKRDPVIVITNPIFPETRARLEDHGVLVANTRPEPWPREEVRRHCSDADAVMAFMTDYMDESFIAQCPRLKVIGAALKGYDNIDIAAAEAAGIWVTIVPDLLTVPTAELAIGLMLALGRNVIKGDALIRTHGFHGWRPSLYGAGLDGATVGIVGFGRVGQAIAQRLAGFGCKILAFDMASDQAQASPPVMHTGFADLLAQSDYVVLALPLSAQTIKIMDGPAIAQMKRGALLVNPARGSLVDEAAVADALGSGQLGGYAADVFECEDWARADRPSRIDPRLTMPGAPTVLTPHLGSAVERVRREIELSAANSIIEALAGHAPLGAVNAPPRPRACLT